MICDNGKINSTFETNPHNRMATNRDGDLQTNRNQECYKYELVDLVVAAAPLTFAAHKCGWQLAELAAAICIWLFVKYLFGLY